VQQGRDCVEARTIRAIQVHETGSSEEVQANGRALSRYTAPMSLAPGEVDVVTLGAWGNSLAGPTSSFCILRGNLQIMLDVGLDPIGALMTRLLSPSATTHVYISHVHSDHVAGLANFIFTRELLMEGVANPAPLVLIAHESVILSVRSLIELQYPNRAFGISFSVLSDDRVITIASGVYARSVRCAHTAPCFGLVLDMGGTKIGYTSDSAPIPSFVSEYADCEVLIGEAFGLEEDVGPDIHQRGHSTAEDLARLASKAEIRLVVPFHFGESYRDPARRSRLLAACRPDGGNVVDPISNPVLRITGGPIISRERK
jgi:ribonuclease BN (tRNA processing enzyme)